MNKELGKIKSVSFGIGGYQDAMLGVFFDLGGNGWGVITDKCAWDCTLIRHDKNCKWSEEDRTRQYDKIMRYISVLLNESKVKTIDKLKGIPVEAIFDNGVLKSWRILTEVL